MLHFNLPYYPEVSLEISSLYSELVLPPASSNNIAFLFFHKTHMIQGGEHSYSIINFQTKYPKKYFFLISFGSLIRTFQHLDEDSFMLMIEKGSLQSYKLQQPNNTYTKKTLKQTLKSHTHQ